MSLSSPAQLSRTSEVNETRKLPDGQLVNRVLPQRPARAADATGAGPLRMQYILTRACVTCKVHFTILDLSDYACLLPSEDFSQSM